MDCLLRVQKRLREVRSRLESEFALKSNREADRLIDEVLASTERRDREKCYRIMILAVEGGVLLNEP